MRKKGMIFFILLMIKSLAFSQCDTALKPSDDPAVSYKKRRDRCEGLYAAKVGVPSIEVASFTIGPFFYDFQKQELIQIKNLTGSPLFIRSSALPLNTYYRMDAFLNENNFLKWEVGEVLYDLGIRSKYLGVFGWRGTEHDKIYLPVRAISSKSDQSDKKFYLLIRPASRVREAKFRYALSGNKFGDKYEDINSSGSNHNALIIVLPENLKGEYIIEVAAKLDSGNGWVVAQYKLSI